MKTAKLLIACLLFAVSGTIHAQWVSIPDNDFATWLYSNGYDLCLQGNNSIGWQMDTTCNEVVSATFMVFDNQNVADLTGIQYFDNLQHLDCMGNRISYIPALPPQLLYFFCSQQLASPGSSISTLTQLPPLPETLLQLDCSYNGLTALPALPAGLQWLWCQANPLTGLPALPFALTELFCSNCNLTEIPALPPDLVNLYCFENPLTAPLPALPSNLAYLDCQSNQLSTMPVLPASLLGLKMGNNPLVTTMPALPAGLNSFSINNTSISSLGTLPTSLLDFNCAVTPVTVIPPLPASLKGFVCDSTPITSLPALPAGFLSLSAIGCYNLTGLPPLPDSLSTLKITNDTNITCLPPLGAIRNFQFSGSGVQCLPNYPRSVLQSSPLLNTIPLCDVFNANGCPVAHNISGKTYHDTDNNCQAGIGEPEVMHVPVQLWNGAAMLQTFTNTMGSGYSFKTSAYGTYKITIDTVNTPYRIKCPSAGSLTSVISALDSIDNNLNFALECKPGFDLEAKSVSTPGIFRPANSTPLEVAAGDASNFYNGHCAAGVSGTVTLSFTGPVKFIAPASGALTPTVAGNTLTYNIANFGTVNFFEDFDIIVQTDTTAQAGQQVCFTLNVTPTSGDNNPANNTFSICYTVVNSFDPNDKQVSPSGNIDTAQRELVYTIRFQNTGNAEAQHIYITDTLSSHINPASFQLLAYSHQPMVQLDGNKLRFNFPNINLPDSTTNEPASHGYVQFKVKLNNGLPVGTVINNTAFIYFDFNAPVITNTTTNTIYVPAPPAIKPVSIGKYRIDRAVKPNGRL